jgi:hypothetical protein
LLTDLTASDDLARKEKLGFRERFIKGVDSAEADTERRDGRYDAMNGRRMGQYEKDGARTRRRNDEDEGDNKSKRDTGDRTRWGSRALKDEAEAKEEEDGSKAGARRDREKFQQPWLRGAKIPESNEDSRRDERKPPDWRRGERGGDRGWDRNDRVEAEPEWMDAGDDDEDPLESKTMQDFEQWKQRMKTGAATTEVKPQPKVDQAPAMEEKVSKPKLASRSEQDDAMDKFYASFGAQKLDTAKQDAQVKAPTKSRFANMFGAPVEIPTKLPTPPPVAPPAQVEQNDRPSSNAQAALLGNADQEGFQRILQMLQTRSNNATPQTQRPGSSRASTQRTEEAIRAQDLQQRPIMDATRVKSPKEEQPRRANESMLEGLLNIRSPPPLVPTHQRQESSNMDERQLLLQLLNQADTREQKRTQMRSADPRHMPGLQAAYLNMNQQASVYNQQLADGNDRRHARHERPAASFDEPPLFNTAEPSQPRRRPTTEQAMPPFFDDTAFRHNIRQNGQQALEKMQGPPPGLGRPPGFDQLRSVPGFSTQQQEQRQARQPGPPPGIPSLPMQQRGLPAQFQPPMSMPGQPQPQPRRKYTGEQGPGFPPGMRPPPGFLQNGPPPDFGGLAMAQNYGRYQVGGEQQGPPRDLHDSRYGAAGRASGMPGPYR